MRCSPALALIPAIVALSACSESAGGPEEPTAPEPSAVTSVPAVQTTTQTEAPPAPVTTTTEAVDLSTVVPSGEMAPTPLLSPIPEPTPQGGPWTALDLDIRDSAQLADASELPDTFRAFMGQRLGVEDEAGCTITAIEAKGVHVDGYVYGAEESTCGTTQAVWGIKDNAWNYVVVFLDTMPCADLEMNGVPPEAPGLRCMAEDGSATDY